MRHLLLKLISSLSHSLWQLALARVVVGTGTAGIELLSVIIMNGKLIPDVVLLPRLIFQISFSSMNYRCGTVQSWSQVRSV